MKAHKFNISKKKVNKINIRKALAGKKGTATTNSIDK